MKPYQASTLLMTFTWLLASCVPAGPIVSTAVAATGFPLTAVVGGGSSPAARTARPATPIPTLAAALGPTELKYRLLDEYPDFFFCDRDFYPVARADELDLARQHFPELEANAEEFEAILAHNGLVGLASFTDDQELLIYRDHKKLAAIPLELAANGYQFELTIADQNRQGYSIKGLIDGRGQITVQQKTPAIATCPICRAAQTLIDTPRGAVFVEDLKQGDLVWTQTDAGERVAAPVLQLVRVPVPATHEMIHVVLSDRRELWASPGHPTVDGRRLGDLASGDILDGTRIERAERVLYNQSATYDLLPAGATGFYWANGILLASTLAR